MGLFGSLLGLPPGMGPVRAISSCLRAQETVKITPEKGSSSGLRALSDSRRPVVTHSPRVGSLLTPVEALCDVSRAGHPGEEPF